MEAARIKAIPLFAGLPEPEVEAIAAVAKEIEAAQGPVASEGDFGHALFAIESGTAEVSVDGEPLRTLGPGDVFGEIAVMSAGRRTASVVATSPLKLITIFKPDVWRLERSAPEAAGRLRGLLDEHRSPAA